MAFVLELGGYCCVIFLLIYLKDLYAPTNAANKDEQGTSAPVVSKKSSQFACLQVYNYMSALLWYLNDTH